MIDVKRALYHAFRFTYPSDSMDYIHEEFNYCPANPLKYDPGKILINKFNEDYAEEIEEILSDPVTLISSFFALPNKFEPGDKSRSAKIKRIGWNMLGWEDRKPLWLNIIRSPFSLIKNLVVFAFLFPLNILKTVSELLPLFLSNLCDQAASENKGNWATFFDCLGVVPMLVHFIGRAATSPAENARFYFKASYDLFNRGSLGLAVGTMALGFMSIIVSGIIIFVCPQVFANVGMFGIASFLTGYLTSMKASTGVIALVAFYQEFARIAGKWWKTVMNEGPGFENEMENVEGSYEEIELEEYDSNNKQYNNTNKNDFREWESKKNDERNENEDNITVSRAGQYGSSQGYPTTISTTSTNVKSDYNPFSQNNM